MRQTSKRKGRKASALVSLSWDAPRSELEELLTEALVCSRRFEALAEEYERAFVDPNASLPETTDHLTGDVFMDRYGVVFNNELVQDTLESTARWLSEFSRKSNQAYDDFVNKKPAPKVSKRAVVIKDGGVDDSSDDGVGEPEGEVEGDPEEKDEDPATQSHDDEAGLDDEERMKRFRDPASFSNVGSDVVFEALLKRCEDAKAKVISQNAAKLVQEQENLQRQCKEVAERSAQLDAQILSTQREIGAADGEIAAANLGNARMKQIVEARLRPTVLQLADYYAEQQARLAALKEHATASAADVERLKLVLEEQRQTISGGDASLILLGRRLAAALLSELEERRKKDLDDLERQTDENEDRSKALAGKMDADRAILSRREQETSSLQNQLEGFTAATQAEKETQVERARGLRGDHDASLERLTLLQTLDREVSRKQRRRVMMELKRAEIRKRREQSGGAGGGNRWTRRKLTEAEMDDEGIRDPYLSSSSKISHGASGPAPTEQQRMEACEFDSGDEAFDDTVPVWRAAITAGFDTAGSGSVAAPRAKTAFPLGPVAQLDAASERVLGFNESTRIQAVLKSNAAMIARNPTTASALELRTSKYSVGGPQRSGDAVAEAEPPIEIYGAVEYNKGVASSIMTGCYSAYSETLSLRLLDTARQVRVEKVQFDAESFVDPVPKAASRRFGRGSAKTRGGSRSRSNSPSKSPSRSRSRSRSPSPGSKHKPPRRQNNRAGKSVFDAVTAINPAVPVPKKYLMNLSQFEEDTDDPNTFLGRGISDLRAFSIEEGLEVLHRCLLSLREGRLVEPLLAERCLPEISFLGRLLRTLPAGPRRETREAHSSLRQMCFALVASVMDTAPRFLLVKNDRRMIASALLPVLALLGLALNCLNQHDCPAFGESDQKAADTATMLKSMGLGLPCPALPNSSAASPTPPHNRRVMEQTAIIVLALVLTGSPTPDFRVALPTKRGLGHGRKRRGQRPRGLAAQGEEATNPLGCTEWLRALRRTCMGLRPSSAFGSAAALAALDAAATRFLLAAEEAEAATTARAGEYSEDQEHVWTRPHRHALVGYSLYLMLASGNAPPPPQQQVLERLDRAVREFDDRLLADHGVVVSCGSEESALPPTGDLEKLLATANAAVVPALLALDLLRKTIDEELQRQNFVHAIAASGHSGSGAGAVPGAGAGAGAGAGGRASLASGDLRFLRVTLSAPLEAVFRQARDRYLVAALGAEAAMAVAKEAQVGAGARKIIGGVSKAVPTSAGPVPGHNSQQGPLTAAVMTSARNTGPYAHQAWIEGMCAAVDAQSEKLLDLVWGAPQPRPVGSGGGGGGGGDGWDGSGGSSVRATDSHSRPDWGAPLPADLLPLPQSLREKLVNHVQELQFLAHHRPRDALRQVHNLYPDLVEAVRQTYSTFDKLGSCLKTWETPLAERLAWMQRQALQLSKDLTQKKLELQEAQAAAGVVQRAVWMLQEGLQRYGNPRKNPDKSYQLSAELKKLLQDPDDDGLGPVLVVLRSQWQMAQTDVYRARLEVDETAGKVKGLEEKIAALYRRLNELAGIDFRYGPTIQEMVDRLRDGHAALSVALLGIDGSGGGDEAASVADAEARQSRTLKIFHQSLEARNAEARAKKEGRTELYYLDGVAVEGGTGGADGGGGVGSDGPGRSRGRGRGRSRRSKAQSRSRSGSQSQSPKPQSGLNSGDNGLSPSAPRKLLTRPLQRHYETIVTLDGSGAGAGAGSGLGSGSGAGSLALRLEPEPNIHKSPPPQALPPRLQRHYRDAVARSQASEDGWAALVPGEPAPSAADGGGWLFDLTALLPPEPLQFDTDADKDRFEDLFGVTFAEVERLEEPIVGGGVGVGGGVARGVRSQSRWADMTDDVDDDRLLPTAKRSHSQAPTRVSASMAASAAAATATATAASASSMPAAGKGGVVTIPAPAAEATDGPLSPSPPSSAPSPAQALQPQPQQSLPSSARAAAMLQNSAAGHLAALLRFMPTRATATAAATSSLGTRSSTGVSASAGGRKSQQGVAERGGGEAEAVATAAAATASALHSSRPPVTVASLSVAPAAANIAQDGPELLAPGFVPAAPPVLRAGSFASPLVRRLA